jgi:two-component sensor histidine kinase
MSANIDKHLIFCVARAGRLLAELRRKPNDMVEVVICDDGVGMAEAREKSLGYGIIRSLVRQIGGTLDIRSVDGLTVTIRFAQKPPTSVG